MLQRTSFFLVLAVVLGAAPVAQAQSAWIDHVEVTPTPPVDPDTGVTITTDFTSAFFFDDWFADVATTPSSVTIDIFVDQSLVTMLAPGTSVEYVGTFQPGTITCVVNIHAAQYPPPYEFGDSAGCDFVVTGAVPGLPAWALGTLVALIAAYGSYHLASGARAV